MIRPPFYPCNVVSAAFIAAATLLLNKRIICKIATKLADEIISNTKHIDHD